MIHKSEKESKIKYYVEINKIKLLIIDEIHNALIGSITKQKEFIVGLKTLTNLLQISMVMVGIDTALNLTNTDQQISSRFRPVFIDKWEYNEDYIGLLYAIEKTLPLKKPSLIYNNEKLAKKILEMSEGLIGEIVMIANLLAEYAITSGKEKIETSMLSKIDYIPTKQVEAGILYGEHI